MSHPPPFEPLPPEGGGASGAGLEGIGIEEPWLELSGAETISPRRRQRVRDRVLGARLEGPEARNWEQQGRQILRLCVEVRRSMQASMLASRSGQSMLDHHVAAVLVQSEIQDLLEAFELPLRRRRPVRLRPAQQQLLGAVYAQLHGLAAAGRGYHSWLMSSIPELAWPWSEGS